MSISISDGNFEKNSTKQITISLSGAHSMGDDEFAFVWSEKTQVELSLDGTNFSDEVILNSNGNFNLWVRTGNFTASSLVNVIGFEYYDGNDYQEGFFETTFTDDAPPPVLKSLNFNFSPRNSTIQFNCEALNSSIGVGSSISGTILDHNYSFEIERLVEQGQTRIISGSAFADELVNSLVNYQVEYEFQLSILGWKRPKFSEHISAISHQINIPIVFIGTDFYPKTDINIALKKGLTLNFYEVFSGSFSEHLARLIGWSDSVPSMTYNLFVKNGTIYIVERGHEQNTVVVNDENNHNGTLNFALRPSLTHSIRKTEWSNSQYQTVVPKEVSSSDSANSNEPYSGTITWSGCSLTYDDGYLIEEVKDNVTTEYDYSDYSDGKRLVKKTITDSQQEKLTVVDYTYQNTDTQVFLYEEETRGYEGTDPATGSLVVHELTRHVPLGGGWYGITTYNLIHGTEEVVASSISQGAPGNKASQYLIDQQNDALKPSGSQRRMTVRLNGVAKARQTYPVSDIDTLRKIAGILDGLEGKEEILLQGEIVGGTHILDFNDKISFGGNIYFLVSNSVSQNFNTIRQNISAVRWVTN